MKSVAFTTDKLVITGVLPHFMTGEATQKKYSTPITPRENYLAPYRGEMPLWIPLYSDMQMMAPRINPDNVVRAIIGGDVPLTQDELVGGIDMFGVEWTYVPVASGSMVAGGNPLLEDANDWEKVITFPDLDTWDWESSAAAMAPYRDYDRLQACTVLNGLYERLISFMDFENAVVALIDEDQKDAVHALLDRLTVFYDDLLDRYKKHYDFDMISMHDDWGSQRAPFFSSDTCREMILPYLKRVVESAHSRGMFFDLHSCGKIESHVPLMIEAGVDSWTPQDVNDKPLLHEMYGDRILIGLDPDIPLDFDTPDAVARAAAQRMARKYCPGYKQKPLFSGSYFYPDAYYESLYEESRRLLSCV